ncbi:hypothetical protein HUG10_21345 (plasmid) [Halorarum halophilum]|uniref:Uncharacterized protein n=1 Tax=Halorarum halophilum TaxID=2743090 RepID=A0A7D5KPC8_9EURY|nr:hypothetical protein [Halobaculum halophilum]QLG30135.1 hypothetical protein HUG10_21345 [Halobaculum halophilum]
MALEDRLEDHLDELRATHEEQIDEYVRAAYDEGLYHEAVWLRNLGAQLSNPTPDPDGALERIRYRTQARVEWYDEALRTAVLDNVDSDDESAYETLASLYDDGLTVDRRGESEEIKWVNPDGSAVLQDREVFYLLTVTPETYYDWATAIAVIEARNVGRVAIQLECEEVMGHVWVDPLDESTTPMAARLHGETYGRDGVPFYPPVTEHGRSRVWPLFQAGSGPAEQLPSVDELVDQRERWFVNYSRMQKGELLSDDWADEPVDLSEHNVEFIYRQLLPRNLDQYLPSHAE